MCGCDVTMSSGRYVHLCHQARRYERHLGTETEDLVHEVWEHTEAHVVEVTGNLKAWLDTCLYHRFITFIALYRRIEPRGPETFEEIIDEDIMSNPEEVIWTLEVVAMVEVCRQRLPLTQARCVREWLHAGAPPAHWMNADHQAFHKGKAKLRTMCQMRAIRYGVAHRVDLRAQAEHASLLDSKASPEEHEPCESGKTSFVPNG